MKERFRSLGKIFKETYKGWNADDPFRQSAVIAYYAIFSLPALLVLIINVAGVFFGHEVVSGEISRQIEGVMGAETAEQVREIVTKAGETKAGLVSSIIAIVTIIFGATGVFFQLQKTLNQIWDVQQKPSVGFLKTLKVRLFSFGLVLSIGFLLLVSLVVSSLLAAFSHWLEAIFPDVIVYLFYVLEFALSLSVISVLFALMFKFLPDIKMSWRNVWIGAFLTSFLFIVGKYGLSFYFGKADPASAYGAAGSVILIMLWASYSSMIVFFGAEFTKQYAVYYGFKFNPGKDAEAVKREKIPFDKSEIKLRKPELGNSIEEKIFFALEEKKQNKMKNKKELEQEILKLENRLSLEKEEIKDNLKLSNILAGLIPRVFRMRRNGHEKPGVNAYLRHVAARHITVKRDTWLDRVKKALHMV